MTRGWPARLARCFRDRRVFNRSRQLKQRPAGRPPSGATESDERPLCCQRGLGAFRIGWDHGCDGCAKRTGNFDRIVVVLGLVLIEHERQSVGVVVEAPAQVLQEVCCAPQPNEVRARDDENAVGRL